MQTITIEDRVLIRELYERFYMGLNDGDLAAIQATFAPGGHVTRYSGEPSTAEFAAATGQYWNADPVGRTYQHHVTNVLVSPDPEGREDFCSVKMYFLVTGVWEPPQIIVRWSCKAYDELQKVDGEWKFWRRQIRLNHDSTGTHWDNEPTHPDWDWETNSAPSGS